MLESVELTDLIPQGSPTLSNVPGEGELADSLQFGDYDDYSIQEESWKASINTV